MQGRETAATLHWPWTGLGLALDCLPWGGRVARDNTNATTHARLPTVVPVPLGGASLDCPGDQRYAEGATAALVALPPWPVGVNTEYEE